jgi:hypothetical protein
MARADSRIKLADIYAYLQSIPKPSAVNDIPLLRQRSPSPAA